MNKILVAMMAWAFLGLAQATVIKPVQLPNFNLSVSSSGTNFNNQNLSNHWTLLFFGFTHCAGICPATMRIMQQVSDSLQKQKVEVPQIVLVSVDPGRDSMKQLKEYAQKYNPKFIGTTGSEEELKPLVKAFGVLYVKTGHHIDHSASIFAINPKGEYQALWSAPHEATKIVQDIITLEKNYQL